MCGNGKVYLDGETRGILEKLMPTSMRNLYKHNGYPVGAIITRRRPLKGYGGNIEIQMRKNGELIWCSMFGYEFTQKEVAENIVGYFVYGEYGYDFNIEWV